ncbi:MAG: alpha/beta fold hydrolase [Rhodobacteraceae bacterium]|jgi:pimeloyl-ACP methyl ester carboxylesterase|nr:alpha/beta fold hydrolase [Paracoccaceae bacterium]
MARFLLIHGSCHGAWCWRDTLPRLVAAGFGARAIDLPSHGADRTPLAEVTLDGYAQAILDAIDEPVVLVGHSMAGFAISRAAELAPEKIAKLVYLCAYLPVAGQSLVDMRRAAPRQPLLDAIVTAPDRVSFTIDPAKARAKFYHDCPDEAVDFARRHLCPEAIAPQAEPINIGARFASVEKHYIRCLDDRTIPPEYQATMASGLAPGHVHVLPTAHSPFFAAPDMLAELLARINEAP